METDQDRKEIDPASKAEAQTAPATPHPNPLPLRGEGAAQTQTADLKLLAPQGERMSGGQVRGGEGASDTLLSSILLPQKDAPSPISTQRVTAGAVLEAATAVAPLPTPAETAAQQSSATAENAALHESSAAQAPEGVSMHTYKSDIEQSVRGRGLSVSDMISSQAKRAGVPEETTTAAAQGSLLRVFLGIAALLAAAGLVGGAWWAYGQLTVPARTSAAPEAAFIRVDMTRAITIPADYTPTDVLRLFTQNRDTLALSLGLVARLEPIREGTTTPMTAQGFFALMNPSNVSDLSRALSPQFLLGVHIFQDNQAFLIFHTDTYAQAYAGMLSWERTMHPDLSPLFDRGASAISPDQSAANTSASSSIASSATAATSPSATPAPQVLTTAFTDRTVENHDARVLQDTQGNILLLWTFLDRNTLVITTNEYTLRELITRLAGAPVVPTAQ